MAYMTANVKKHIPSSPDGFVALTHDSGTSIATESYDTVTAHFVTRKWDLRTSVLQTTKMEGSHTGENISQGLQETISQRNLPIPILVTDNAANERKAIEILGWQRIGCYGHRINLMVKNSLEAPEISRILAKCRKLVTNFHKSTSLNDVLMQKQLAIFTDEPNLIGHKLIADVCTRWNSTLDMLQRILEQMPAILAIASDNNLSKSMTANVKDTCFSCSEHSVVENLVELLLPFKRATAILCAENCPTMNKVLPAFFAQRLAYSSQDSMIIVKF